MKDAIVGLVIAGAVAIATRDRPRKETAMRPSAARIYDYVAPERPPYLPKLMGFCGLMGSGKDWYGKRLEERGYVKVSFADPLKEEAAAELGITVPELEARKAEFRPLLQNLGGGRRAANPDYWLVRWWERVAPLLQAGKRVYTADVRYQNEADLVASHSGMVCRVWVPERIRIERLMRRDGEYNPAWMKHPTEVQVPGLLVHAQVDGGVNEQFAVNYLEAVYRANVGQALREISTKREVPMKQLGMGFAR